MLRSLCLILIGLCVSACGSTGTTEYTKSEITGIPMTIKLTDYRNGNVIRIVNDSHSDRLETYSEERAVAGTKVASDEVVAETVKYMLENGFDDHSIRGLAPYRSADYAKSLEIDDPQGVRYFAIHAGSSEQELMTMHKCSIGLIEVYNAVHSAQTVTNASGADLFYEQQQRLKQERERNR